jgi:hypothetical protein
MGKLDIHLVDEAHEIEHQFRAGLPAASASSPPDATTISPA